MSLGQHGGFKGRMSRDTTKASVGFFLKALAAWYLAVLATVLYFAADVAVARAARHNRIARGVYDVLHWGDGSLLFYLAPLILFGTFGVAFVWLIPRYKKPSVHRLCRSCGYDLRGSSGTVCPECGNPLEADPEAGSAQTSRGRRAGDWSLVGAFEWLAVWTFLCGLTWVVSWLTIRLFVNVIAECLLFPVLDPGQVNQAAGGFAWLTVVLITGFLVARRQAIEGKKTPDKDNANGPSQSDSKQSK